MGRKLNGEDKKITKEELRVRERRKNEHTKMWSKITNAGEAHGHNGRIRSSKNIESEIAANKYYMFKDHKEGEKYRPVVSGCCSNTLGLSGLLSDIIESLCLAVENPFEVISSEDLLANINEFNEEIKREIEKENSYDWRKDYVLLGTDVVSLFPSMSAEKTGEAIRKQVEKSKISWEEIDEKWLSLYVRLNRELCYNYEEIENLLPIRRRGRRGKEAGMGSQECDKRHLEDNEKSNWEWPNLPLNKEKIKILMGRALEISIKFFFNNFCYTFGGDLYIQVFGGPIGARLTMCAARIVMQQRREEYRELLDKSNLKEKFSRIYVDDNRTLMEILKPGVRFVEEEKLLV